MRRAAGPVVLLALLAAPAPAAAALECRPGARASGLRPAGVAHRVLGCRRLNAVGRVQVTAHRKRSGYFCVLTRVRRQGTFGCGTHEFREAFDVDLFADARGGRIAAGAAGPWVRRIVYRWRERGLVRTRRAGLIRVRDRPLLRRLGLRRPFGAHRIYLPDDATQVVAEAFGRRGRLLEQVDVGGFPAL